MSNEKVVCVNELTIRFEQLEGRNSVNWSIIPDEIIEKFQDSNLIDLAEMGAPLSALGVMELWNLCASGLIYAALEAATYVAHLLGFQWPSLQNSQISYLYTAHRK